MNINSIIKKKGKEKIVMLTVYDYLTAKIISKSNAIDMVLVGDSLGNVVLGYENTLSVRLEDIIHHLKAVKRGIGNLPVIADMPFLSYGTSLEKGILNAGELIRKGANAVKIEGVSEIELIKKLITLGIPVMGHIGLQPQQVLKTGYKIAGKTQKDKTRLMEEALLLEKAGVFSIVVEGTTEEAAKEITERLSIPTIGIGAGRYTDGQVLVITDMLGMDKETNIKHNKKYANLYDIINEALLSFSNEVKNGKFPEENNIFHTE